MKSFNATMIVRHPLEIVWSTIQDELPQLALLMEDIRSVSTLERVKGSEMCPLTNLWESVPQLPAAVAKIMPR